MLSIIKSSGILGIEGFIVDVEVDITNGIPVFNIVGLPDASIRESKDRVKSAILNSGYNFPNSRIIINLSPADIRKEGPYFDLSIAMGILREYINESELYINESLFIGQLSLEGKLKPVKGILPIVINAKNKNIRRIFIPYENYKEALFIDGIDVIPVRSLKECIDFINKNIDIQLDMNSLNYEYEESYDEDFMDVKGNYFIKRGAEIAAAGNHNLLMIGPPGSGKTMIAKRIRTILPSISQEEIIEVSKIYSSIGMIDSNLGIMNKRPFRSPHHTTTKQSIIGGGADARPGEVVLAHRGVLFLDEMAEFDRRILETLRQPIEDRYINISRLKMNLRYPCSVLLVASMNPCPCGYHMSERDCKCKGYEINRYLNKISGPLLDRFDMFVQVNPVSFSELSSKGEGEDSYTIRKRIEKCREVQKNRFKEESIYTNSEIKPSMIDKYCILDEQANNFMSMLYNKYNLSSRGYTKLITTARTIADLDESENINISHISEAFSFRKAYYSYFDQ